MHCMCFFPDWALNNAIGKSKRYPLKIGETRRDLRKNRGLFSLCLYVLLLLYKFTLSSTYRKALKTYNYYRKTTHKNQ